MKDAKQYFDNHDTVDRLFFTNDGLAFFDEQNAINHATSLEDETVTEMTRDEVYSELDELENGQWEEEYDPLDELDAE